MWAIADEQETPNDIHFGFDYSGPETLSFPVEGSYADLTAEVDAEVEHSWLHPLGEIVTVLAREGLRIELLDEKAVLDWPVPFLEPIGGGRYSFPPGQRERFPLMYPSAPARRAEPAQAAAPGRRSLDGDRAAARVRRGDARRSVASSTTSASSSPATTMPSHAAVTCLFADGNLLLEGVPGVGQDHPRAGARGLDRRRVLAGPGDPGPAAERPDRDQRLRAGRTASSGSSPGPVFANVVLVDEINRATPRTQSALLEPMEERQVTVEGVTHPLPAALPRDRDGEPRRAARDVSAPRGAARPVRDVGPRRLPRRGRLHRSRPPPAGARTRCATSRRCSEPDEVAGRPARGARGLRRRRRAPLRGGPRDGDPVRRPRSRSARRRGRACGSCGRRRRARSPRAVTTCSPTT